MELNSKQIERKDISKEFQWHIEDIFSSDAAFEDALKKCSFDIHKLSDYKGQLGSCPAVLLKYLSLKEELSIQLDSIYCYAFQQSDVDTANPFYQNLKSQGENLWNAFYNAVSFEDPELLSLPEDYIANALSSESGLVPFRHYLENTLRMKAHTLSDKEEALLSLAQDIHSSPQSVFYMFNNADIHFPNVTDSAGNTVEITTGRFVPLLESSDRALREKTFKAFYSTYNSFKNTIAAMYTANLKHDLFFSKARHYASSRQAHLDSNRIPEAVYDRLIDAVHDALPVMYRYVSLRKKLLGVSELHMYDVYTPLTSEEHPAISYDTAKAMVSEGLRPLGSNYIQALNEGMNAGWIDVYENKGKRSGAYSSGDYAHHPYVLLNYQGTLDNVFTLAHEMGHSMHTWYASHNQTFTNAQYCIFVAEIASTCNESLLMNDLLNKCTDKHEKLYLLNHYLDTFKGTLFRQTMFAEFEKITHEKIAAGEPLNAQSLCQIYHDLNVLYFGPDMVVDPEIDLEWARIPHFYTPFYVYQYATGFSAAIALSSAILNEGAPAVKRYLRFLSTGGADYPVDVLKEAGVDMTTKAPVANALQVFGHVLSEMETLIEELYECI